MDKNKFKVEALEVLFFNPIYNFWKFHPTLESLNPFLSF